MESTNARMKAEVQVQKIEAEFAATKRTQKRIQVENSKLQEQSEAWEEWLQRTGTGRKANTLKDTLISEANEGFGTPEGQTLLFHCYSPDSTRPSTP
jgi:hypothetical protein